MPSRRLRVHARRRRRRARSARADLGRSPGTAAVCRAIALRPEEVPNGRLAIGQAVEVAHGARLWRALRRRERALRPCLSGLAMKRQAEGGRQSVAVRAFRNVGMIREELLKRAHDLLPLQAGRRTILFSKRAAPREAACKGARDDLDEHAHARLIAFPRRASAWQCRNSMCLRVSEASGRMRRALLRPRLYRGHAGELRETAGADAQRGHEPVLRMARRVAIHPRKRSLSRPAPFHTAAKLAKNCLGCLN